MIIVLPNVAGEAWEFHDCRFTAEALLDGNFFSQCYFSSSLSDCTQVRWHLQPLPALGSEQTVERTGLRRILPARSAPSRAAVPFHLGFPGLFCGETEVAFSLPSLSWSVPREWSVEEMSASCEKWEGVEEQQVLLCPRFSCSSVRWGGGGSAVPQHLNSAGEPTAGFFCETPPVTVSISELERHQGYTASKSYHCPLCFILPFTLPLQLQREPYPRCFPNMTHSSAYKRRESVQTRFPARCWKGQSRQAKAQLGPIANVFKPLQRAQSSRVFFETQ